METRCRCGMKKYYQSGLNRTMQYGNIQKIKINKTKWQGLNRTMQYGNPILFF